MTRRELAPPPMRARAGPPAAIAAARALVVLAGATALSALALAPRAAWAYGFTLSSRTVGQGYQERRYGTSGAGELLSRRRLTQYLSLSVFDIEPEGWRGPAGDRNALSFELGLRFDSDFGRFLLDRPRGTDAIAELAQNQIDVLYAYVAGRDLGGRVDFQLGRQIHFDLVDFYAYDGADVAVRFARLFQVEAFGGMEVRGELPLSAPIYELDGTSAGSRDPATRPGQAQALRPLVGAALALDRGLALPFGARIAYRQALSPTADERPGDPADPSWGVNHETVSGTADAALGGRLFVTGGVRYNLLFAAWDDAQAALRLRAGSRHGLSLEYSYLAPTFDGDSIWNVFGAGATRDVRAGYDVVLGSALRAHARGFVRQFLDGPGDAAVTAPPPPGGAPADRWAAGANVGADGRAGRGRARTDLFVEGGYGGWKVGGDAFARWMVRPRLLDVEGRLTVYAWRADGAPEPREAVMAGLQVGGLYQMSRQMRLHLLLEDNSGTYYRAQLRGLAVLEVDASL